MTITEMYGVLDGLIKEGYGPCEILSDDGEDLSSVEFITWGDDGDVDAETVAYLR